MIKPKIVTLDIETSPLESYTWGLWEQNVGLDQIKTEWSILAYAARELGKQRTVYKDTGGRGVGLVRDDSKLLTDLWHILDSADIIVAQNGTRFDIKKINARLIAAGYGPYSPIRVIDTLTAAKKHFAFTSNKLAWTSKYLTDVPKSEHKEFPGFELWKECLLDNPRAWKVMKKYNVRDVLATEKYYLRLRPWISAHPNLGAYVDGHDHNCPKCGSAHVTKQGINVTQQGRRQQYQCQDCGSWSHGKQQIISAARRGKLLK